MSIYLKNFLRYALLVFLQVALLNKIPLRWWAEPMGFPVFVPMIYPLVIILLPFNTSKPLVYILGFLCGLSIDMFCNTPGQHALSTLLLAGLRPYALNIFLPKNLEEYGGQTPSVKNMFWLPFLTYAALLILVHHFIFFTIELWSWKNIVYLLIKTVSSALTTLLFVLIYVMLFTKTPEWKTVFNRK